MRTGKQISSDVIKLLENSPLNAAISGGVYHSGFRPRDSHLEDIIVIFTTGLPEQIQTGIVTVNIYVPDVKNLENGQRCAELEAAAVRWVESLTTAVSDYRFTLQQTVYTENDADIHQHFVVIKLKYELFEI
jgi:hypothetical protein